MIQEEGKPAPPSAVDWGEIHARLERSRRALEAGGELPPGEVERILRERAKSLARPREEAPEAAAALDLLVFAFGGERYGIEMDHAVEVIPVQDLVPVPCTPPFVLGVVNHRGQALPVLDIRKLAGLPGQAAGEKGRVIVVKAGKMTLGVFAGAVEGTARAGADELALPPAPPAGGREAFIRGVTREMVGVLDLDALARDSRI
ncbi:MAG: purine-binding chemotaxis protein CheW, partial [Candidatus Tectomicrobia bacterium]|nr:purine-binding chemotaxis protein CheW [Candidatus Tectomicrobia bacterium]